MASDTVGPLKHTPLHSLHVSLGARMVPFAGYDMPVQYPGGIIAEHQHTRNAAGLFDVSHMGQAILAGPDHDTTARALETLVPADIVGLPPGQQRYTQLLSDDGGIIDDLMVTRPADPDDGGKLILVVNAACKDDDYAHISARLPAAVKLVVNDRALIALQGPKATDVLARFGKDTAAMTFMTARRTLIAGLDAHVSRSGYTGEDGYEISVSADDAVTLAQKLLAEPEVRPIGLGARDSLRLEAGLCLYGHDIDATTSPVEAGLTWSIAKRRRENGGFPGEARIRRELTQGTTRLLVGILPEGRAPAREGAEIRDGNGARIGTVTSGGFGPTLGHPLAMGYVTKPHAAPGTVVILMVRGKELPAKVVKMPFVPHRYFRG
ncbi:MAG TPA: glycine cleavage system aminomethyltransferase GcvT [Pseudorhodoplanes sp.]|nr:glycine cleavage system aminomethyltransferase GcvT [Pseudorhodoplanes sp.]